MLQKQEILSIVIAIIGVIALVIGVFIGWFILSDILNFLPQIIIPSIFAILIWGFRQRIWDKLFPKAKDLQELKIFHPPSEMKLGHPHSFENDIYYYNSREDLPKFNDFINYATESIDISAITSTLMILQHSNVIKNALKKGIKFTFLLLDKNSEHIDTYKKILKNSEDLENQISTSIERLCGIKKELDTYNLAIKTYDLFENVGIIVVDKNKDKALIKIEEYNSDNPNRRRNELAFKIHNTDFYESSLTEYNKLLDESKDVC